jgi:oligopeptide/dipeptide ABC transporter ATP-binding protein
MNVNNPILSCEHLCKEYQDNRNRKVVAVNNLTLSIQKGETFGLVGESGSGKSTLGYLLVNLLHPTGGTIRYASDSAYRWKWQREKALRRQHQIVFQDPYSSLNPKKKIGWLVEEPLIIHAIGKNVDERRALVTKILEEVGLDDSYCNRWPSELSGGQRQRVAIAIALILNPSFIVYDEAVSALDVSVQAQVLNLLRTLQKKHDLTYLFISHNLHVVSYMSDRIGVLYLGTLVELGDTASIHNEALHPYTKALFSASVDIHQQIGERIILEGEIPSPSNPPSGCPFHTRCRVCENICRTIKPELVEVLPNHFCACHLVKGVNK